MLDCIRLAFVTDSSSQSPAQYRFGPFEVDVRAGELRKRGIRLPLREQPFQLLLLLLEHAAQVVLRDEISACLWPNETVVDYDHGINTTVRRLRAVLGESAGKAQYIETVARRGYRFLGKVELVVPQQDSCSQQAGNDLEGKTVGHYRVFERLGSGGMGVVFRARDLKLDRNVALKFPPEEFGGHPQILERFRREARAAAALNHPNICTIYEVGEEAQRPFIAMELLEGQTLRDRLAASPSTVEETVHLAIEIADALEAAHARGIVHRDIKPANLFITLRGQAKILDFGLAKLSAQCTSGAAAGISAGIQRSTSTASGDVSAPGVPMGTLAYTSPEQIRGEVADCRSDIFSLGAVLYEMLTGRPALSGRSSRSASATTDPVDLPGTLPADLRQIVRKCLEKEPAARFQSAANLKRALRSVAKPAAPELTAAKRSRTPIVAAALVLLLIAFAIKLRYERNLAAESAMPGWDAVQVSRLTAIGQVQDAAISPDGQFVVYVSGGGAQLDLRMRNLITGADIEIGALGGLKPGLAVSPDGTQVYFIQGPDWGPGTLYRVSVNGGLPAKVAAGVDSPPSFSPAGDELAFYREDSQTGGDQVVVAQPDGTKRILAHSRFPLFVQAPAWSPRGDVIAYAATPQKYFHTALLAQPAVGNGTPRPITPADWYRIESLVWIDGGSAILFEGEHVPNENHQIWKVTYPEGKVARITADLDSYHDLSVSRDSKLLVALRRESVSQMLVIETGSGNLPEHIRQVTAAGSGGDGRDGMAFGSDGRLVFSSGASGAGELWIMDADGSHRQQITRTGARNLRGSLSRDGRILVCASTRGGGHDIWRMRSDGTDARQLTTTGSDSEATISPDGRWIAYMSMANGKRSLRRMDADGTHQAILSDKPMLPESPAISPDGRRVAFLAHDPVAHSDQIVVIPAGGGEPAKTFNVPGYCAFQWTPAGDAVAFVRGDNGAQNIWAQPLNGGPARQITHFREGAIFRFAWSWSGKQLALVQVRSTSDAVLIRPVR